MSGVSNKYLFYLFSCFYCLLFFVVAPNITVGPDSQAVLLNATFTLVCIAEGRPAPDITWFQNSTDNSLSEVMERDGLSIVTVQGGERQVMSNLTINSVLLSDAAEYTCNATNVAGSDAQSANLAVHGILSTASGCMIVLNIYCFFFQ